MKIEIIGLIIITILVGTIIAGGVIIRKDKTIGLSPEAKAWYDNNNFLVSYKDSIDGSRCLLNNVGYSLECSLVGLTELERDVWLNEAIETFAQFQIHVESMVEPEVVQEGTITLT